jgi:hypothetical protein
MKGEDKIGGQMPKRTQGRTQRKKIKKSRKHN